MKLEKFSLFKGMPLELTDSLQQQHSPITMLKGEYVVKKGHANKALHFLMQGEFGVYLDDDAPPFIIPAGSVIGEISLLDQKSVSASVICLTNCHIITIDETVVWKLVEQSHLFTINFLHLIVSRFRRIISQVEISLDEKRFIRNAFSQYLSPDVIEKIVSDPSSLQLGGEKRELSLFFSDIEGFSAIAEQLSPEKLVMLLNDYLTMMTDIIMDEGGTLDKYGGDAIIAFWNAPLSQQDHAIHVCRAALRCQRQLTKIYQHSQIKLRTRIGIHTGDVVVGNIGSRQRFDYTILGDAANLTSRLEGANKHFGTYIMVSESTWIKTKHKFIGRKIGTIKVIGRTTTVTVFELLGFKHEPLSENILLFNQGLELYEQKNLVQAAEIFATIQEDPVARVYLNRCRTDKIDANWDGVWVLSEK